MNKLKQFSVFHPFLFAVFPILFLFAYNIDEVPATDLWLPICVAIIGTLILLLSLRLITKNYNKTAIVTSFLLILFFSYGHVRDAISSLGINGLDVGQVHISNQFILAPLWLLLFIAGAFLVIKARRDFSTSTKFFNVVAATLVVISLVNISIYEVRALNRVPEETNKGSISLNSGNPHSLPDIYYIILDAYARQDTLKEVYGYDNSEFINYLTSKGFYVATQSRSNYGSTSLSLPSSLNMDYLKGEERGSTATLLEMMGNSKASRFLKEKGYRYIFVGGGADFKGMAKYTDVYLTYKLESIFRKSDFVDSLAHTTALSPFLMFFEGFFGDNDRKARLYAFDKLADIPDIGEPTFVYAHILSPHPPFIFDRDGNPPKQSIFIGTGNIWQSLGHEQRYVDQLIFINKKVETLVDEIVSKSDVPPIVILQADHGIWWEEGEGRDILNAYYLPGKGNQLLYESITPVNSFRIIFNLYFGTEYELLKDESR